MYEFAVAARSKRLERGHLLRSITPLYLGRVASFFLEVEQMSAQEVEQRIESLCLTFEEMKPYAAKLGWDFPYLYDGDKQLTARAYGCLATPHVFIFDQQRKLRYAGRFDDSRFSQEETVKSPDTRNALEALFAGREVPVPLTKPHGCSTKWREKHTGNVATIQSTWQQIFRSWLPSSGLRSAETPDFEVYGEQFDAATGEGGVEIWVGVKPAA